jgi:hypothetical protein
VDAPPLAVSTKLLPEQIVLAVGLTVVTWAGLTFTVTTVVEVQPPVVPVTVYVVVTVGLATGLAILVALSPVAGLQLYVVAPLAVSPTLLPLHIPGLAGITVTVGVGFTVTVIIWVPLQVPVVPVTVYVVVAIGLAFTVVPTVALNPAAGAQL